MGTNYAVKGERFQSLEDGELHIGKKSSGWVFAFQSQSFTDPETREEISLRSFPDYLNFLGAGLRAGEIIVDEYGKELTYMEILRVIFHSAPTGSSGEFLADWSYRDHGFDFHLRDFS